MTGSPAVRRIEVHDVVAYFWSDCNKWIRAVVESKNSERELLHIWSQDYGLPFTTRLESVRPLPIRLAQRQLQNERIGVAGISNAIPVDLHYDVDKRKNEIRQQRTWSPSAIAHMQKMIDEAAALEFIGIGSISVGEPRFERIFGRLFLNNANSVRTDALTHLINCDKARFNSMLFDTELKTVSNTVWKTSENVPFHSQITSAPANINSGAFAKIRERRHVDNSKTAPLPDTQKEENEFFDSSVSTINQPVNRKSVNNRLQSKTNFTIKLARMNASSADSGSQSYLQVGKPSSNGRMQSDVFNVPNNRNGDWMPSHSSYNQRRNHEDVKFSATTAHSAESTRVKAFGDSTTIASTEAQPQASSNDYAQNSIQFGDQIIQLQDERSRMQAGKPSNGTTLNGHTINNGPNNREMNRNGNWMQRLRYNREQNQEGVFSATPPFKGEPKSSGALSDTSIVQDVGWNQNKNNRRSTEAQPVAQNNNQRGNQQQENRNLVKMHAGKTSTFQKNSFCEPKKREKSGNGSQMTALTRALSDTSIAHMDDRRLNAVQTQRQSSGNNSNGNQQKDNRNKNRWGNRDRPRTRKNNDNNSNNNNNKK